MVSAQVCLYWMVRPSSRGLSPPVSNCFVTCMLGVGWCVRLPEVLSPPLSACVPSSPTYVPVSDAASAFPRSCLPLSPTVFPHMCACVGWCVHLSPLVSPCFPHIVAHVSLRWKVCSPSRGLVSPLSPHIYTSPYPPPCPNASHCFHCPPLLSLSPHMRACGWWARLFEVSLCWMVRPHSRALVSPGLPACLPCLPTCVPVADDAPAFPRSCPALSVLDAVSVFPRSCPPLSPFLFPILDGVSAFLKPCLPSYSPRFAWGGRPHRRFISVRERG